MWAKTSCPLGRRTLNMVPASTAQIVPSTSTWLSELSSLGADLLKCFLPLVCRPAPVPPCGRGRPGPPAGRDPPGPPPVLGPAAPPGLSCRARLARSGRAGGPVAVAGRSCTASACRACAGAGILSAGRAAAGSWIRADMILLVRLANARIRIFAQAHDRRYFRESKP